MKNKNFNWNLIGTSLNAFNSLFFMIIVTRFVGLEAAGVFTMSFSLACLFCIIGNYSGRIFQVTDIKKELNDKEYIINRIITCSLMMLIVGIYIVLSDYSMYKNIILVLLCLFKCLEAFSEVFFGILQKNDKLYKVGFSLSVKSILCVITFLIISLIFKNVVFACVIIDFVWLISIIIYDIPQSKDLINFKSEVKIKNILKLFKIGFFTFSFMFLSIYLVNLTKYLLDGRVPDDLQAVFGIIIMPATVISLFAQYLINPYLKSLTDLIKNNDIQGFNKLIKKLLFYIIIIGLVAVAGIYLVGIPILNLIYGVNLNSYLIDLIIIMFGSVFLSMSSILSAALTTIRQTFIQLLNYIFCSIFGTIISIILINKFGLTGASISYLVIMFIQFLIYVITYEISLKKRKLQK